MHEWGFYDVVMLVQQINSGGKLSHVSQIRHIFMVYSPYFI